MNSLEVKTSKFYPYISKNSTKKRRNSVVLGIGGNEGDVVLTFKKLFIHFKNNARFLPIESSFLLKNPPFGYLEQNDFLNTVLLLETNLSYYQLLGYIIYLEKRFGRVRSFKNAPRTLDIDIIFFNNLKIRRNNLNIPHRYWQDRISVTLPLSYLKGY